MEFLTQIQRKLKKLWKFGRAAMSDWIKDTLYGYEFFDHSRFDYAEKNIKDIIHGQSKQVSLEADYLNY